MEILLQMFHDSAGSVLSSSVKELATKMTYHMEAYLSNETKEHFKSHLQHEGNIVLGKRMRSRASAICAQSLPSFQYRAYECVACWYGSLGLALQKAMKKEDSARELIILDMLFSSDAFRRSDTCRIWRSILDHRIATHLSVHIIYTS